MTLKKITTTTMTVKKGAIPTDTIHYLCAPPFKVGRFNLELLVHAGDDEESYHWAELGYGGNWQVADLMGQLSERTMKQVLRLRDVVKEVQAAWCAKFQKYELREFFHEDLMICVMTDKHDNPIQAWIRIGKQDSPIITLEKKVRYEYDTKDYQFSESVDELVDITVDKHDDGTATIRTEPLEPMSNN